MIKIYPKIKQCINIFILILIVIIPINDTIATETKKRNPVEFVGSDKCIPCHQQQNTAWRQSDHFRAMQVANADTVLGDFSNKKISFHGYASRFFVEDGLYFIETINNNGKKQVYPVRYTFGYRPLQQYLLDIGDGKLQAFDIAWDTRSKKQGGQRWFHLQPDVKITTEHPFFWTRHFQNWNSRCAKCHSTNLKKNYSPKSNRYDTKWSEINVACEACHGPGSKHLELAQKNKLSKKSTGFSILIKQPLNWSFKKGEAIATPRGTKNDNLVNLCGSCHSLRTLLLEDSVGVTFNDSSRLQLLNKGSYFDDGQIREEVFVMGSFLQSKMHGKGVTCINCHNPHSGKVLIKGNGLCRQCHRSTIYDSNKHHHHKANSTGAVCVNCHMPNRTYMQVDDRRDHSFTIPRPDLSIALGVPNACTQCHNKKANDALWANKQLLQWGVKQNKDHWAYLNRRAQLSDPLVTRQLTTLVDKKELPAVIRASLLDQLSVMPSRVSIETAKNSLQDSSPLVRRAAVSSVQQLPANLRWQLLSPYLHDKSRSVRFELARTLADVLNQLPANQQTELAKLITEYRESLAVSSDEPATQVAIANLELQLGNTEAVEQAYLQALRIEPGFVQALINLADYYRETRQELKSEPLYKKALRIAPDDGAVHHGYGLYLIRKQQYNKALPYLKAALKKTNVQPRYAYVYAIALENNGQIKNAINVLKKASKHWPNQYDILMTLILYLEKIDDKNSIYKYLTALSALAPNAPDVKKLVKKYSR